MYLLIFYAEIVPFHNCKTVYNIFMKLCTNSARHKIWRTITIFNLLFVCFFHNSIESILTKYHGSNRRFLLFTTSETDEKVAV